MTYPHKTIWMNGRLVTIESIRNEFVKPNSAFEHSTFSFIKEWLSEKNNFETQTSGSTGEPKTISFSRAQMIASARATAKALHLAESMNGLVCIDTNFIGGKMMLVRCLEIGLGILAVDPTACPLQKLPVDHCVNFAAFVPYQIHSMLGSKHPHLLDTLDIAIIGGAPLEENDIQRLQIYLCKIYTTYGMTETISHVALRKINGTDSSNAFTLLEGIEARQDDRSCLVVKVPYLPGDIVTNDVVTFYDKHNFEWAGRLDNIINTGGVKVQPEKIEASIAKFFQKAGINNRFFIAGLPDEKLGSKVSLIIESSSRIEGLEKIFPDFLSTLSPYERPRQIFTSSHFSSSEGGKINRKKTLESLSVPIPVSK